MTILYIIFGLFIMGLIAVLYLSMALSGEDAAQERRDRGIDQ